eukprot:2748077-Prymnesium_polylepis.1
MWKKFQDVFNVLPFAALIDEKIFCVHAGLSPDLNSPQQLRAISRPTDVPDNGLLCDLLWSDPEADMSGWAENDRGVSYTFGADVVSKFLQKHDYDLIVRAHQVVEDGNKAEIVCTSRDHDDLHKHAHSHAHTSTHIRSANICASLTG